MGWRVFQGFVICSIAFVLTAGAGVLTERLLSRVGILISVRTFVLGLGLLFVFLVVFGLLVLRMTTQSSRSESAFEVLPPK